MKWKCRERLFECDGGKPLVMGILNVTPDSFSDGGCFESHDRAIEHGLKLLEDGADIIDVGGESTRPGAAPVPVEEELRRAIPIVEKLVAAGGAVSIDTRKAEVAKRALEAGASIVNDVSAMTADELMPETARSFGAGVILMHMAGEPATMQDDPRYNDVLSEVRGYLRQRAESIERAGISRDSIAIDPGIGFGKTVAHNVELVANIAALRGCGRPVVLGVSRKRFLGALTGREVGHRLAASIAAMLYAAAEGVDILRVHDVKEARDALTIYAAFKREKTGNAVV